MKTSSPTIELPSKEESIMTLPITTITQQYDQGAVGGKMQVTMITRNLPIGATVSFAAVDTGTTPICYLPPTTVNTNPFSTGIMVNIPANWTSEIIMAVIVPTGTDLSQASVQLQASYPTSDSITQKKNIMLGDGDYDFTEAKNVMAIAEQEYGTAGEILFTAFTSCVGVMARTGSQITGVHLVLMGKGDVPFDDDAADEVLKLIGNAYEQVFVIGSVSLWEKENQAFVKMLGKLKNPQKYSYGDGTFGGKINAKGELEITYKE